MKKLAGYHHFTRVPKITIIWCTVPEIWSETDRIFYDFGSFLPFYHTPLMILKIKILKKKKKKKKMPEDINLYTYKCTINEDHMIYGSWNIRSDRQKFLSFWVSFLPLSQSPDNPENQNFKIKKTPGDIITLHICNINDNHKVPEIWSMKNRIFCHSGPFFALLPPPRDPENQNFEKIKKP